MTYFSDSDSSDSEEEYENDEGEEEDENGDDENEVVNSDEAADENNKVMDENLLKEGDKFNSFEKLGKKVTDFEEKEYAFFYHRDAVTIERCRTKGIKRHVEASLMYYSIKYFCIHGGKNFISTSKGARKAFSFQKNCPAFFSVVVDKTGHYLVIKSINMNHNHDRSENLFRHYPRSRRLTKEQKEKIAELLDLESNRVKVKDMMESQTDKIILLKDLDNCKFKKKKQNLLIPTLQKLENKFKAQWLLYEKENTFAGLFFATESMKSAMDSYPEFMGIDATFKLLNIRAPVYLMVVEDPNGCSEVAGVCILVSEDRESINWMMNSFKTAHPKWDQIKCVMTDKDINERDAIREALPSANLIICAFHTLRIFNREITTDKRNITRDQRDAAKSILQKMVFSETEEEYDLLYEELKEMPQSVVDYFNENWHSIRNEWSLNNTFMHGNFLNNTNNRLESLNSKIRQACNYNNTLEEFVEKLITFFCCRNSERDHKAAYAYQKKELITFEESSPLQQYHDFLTPYAFKFVQEEYDLKKFVNVDVDTPESQELIISYDGLSRIETSVDSCDCTKFRSMTLPCRYQLCI